MDAVLRTIRGERSLPVTYWLWFTLPFAFLTGLERWLDYAVWSRAEDFTSLLVTAIPLLLAQAFIIYVIGYGVLQAGRKRMGVWGVVAMLIVVGSMARFAIDNSKAFEEGFKSSQAAAAVQTVEQTQQEVLASMASQLPMKVDEITTLDRVSFEGTTFVYHYTVTAEGWSQPDLSSLRTIHLPNYCKAYADLKTPGVIDVLRFDYTSTKGDQEIISITDKNCP